MSASQHALIADGRGLGFRALPASALGLAARCWSLAAALRTAAAAGNAPALPPSGLAIGPCLGEALRDVVVEPPLRGDELRGEALRELGRELARELARDVAREAGLEAAPVSRLVFAAELIAAMGWLAAST